MSEPFRRTAEGIAVALDPPLRRWLAEQAADTAEASVSLGDPVHRRLLGPIDPTVDHDDPVVELQRQFGVEGSLQTLLATTDATELTEGEAEEWIRALQLILAATAARLEVADEHDVAALDERSTAVVTTLQALISLLIDALDA